MSTVVCEACGFDNPADTQFCQRCHTFLGWNSPNERSSSTPTTAVPVPKPAEEMVETRVIPKVAETQPSPEINADGVLRVEAPEAPVVLPLDGSTATLDLRIRNRSNIVDGYAVDLGGAPSWLKVESDQLRLLPDTDDLLSMRFRIVSDSLVPAGQGAVQLRVRSLNQAPAHQIVSLALTVPVVDAPVGVRLEPSVVRIKDVDTARFTLVVDNSAANQAAKLRFSGSDPELAVSFHLDPAGVTLGPGETTRVRVVTTSPRPEPGRELTRSLTLTATAGQRQVSATATLVQSTSVVVEDPMVELTAAPALLRLRDADTGSVRVTVDNRTGRQWATVRLDAADPERVVRVDWSLTEVRVPPGGTTDVDLRVSAPGPEAGAEVTRSVMLTASDGRRTARTRLDLVQVTSASPMTTLAVHLDPSVLRIGNGRRGTLNAVVDNRRGQQPVRVWLTGDDPENLVRFTCTPAELLIDAGQTAASRVQLQAPRPPTGQEMTRSFTLAATDGRAVVVGSGSLIQAAADRRPWLRVVLTLLGALLMIMGGLGLTIDVDIDGANLPANLPLGLVIVVLAGLMAFGLTGRSGRLTRFTAVVAALVAVALIVVPSMVPGLDVDGGQGVLLILLGCVLGYVGGLLARR